MTRDKLSSASQRDDSLDGIDEQLARDDEKFSKKWGRQREDVEKLLSVDGGLTPWEVEFAESCSRRMIDAGTKPTTLRLLTAKQERIVNDILERLNL